MLELFLKLCEWSIFHLWTGLPFSLLILFWKNNLSLLPSRPQPPNEILHVETLSHYESQLVLGRFNSRSQHPGFQSQLWKVRRVREDWSLMNNSLWGIWRLNQRYEILQNFMERAEKSPTSHGFMLLRSKDIGTRKWVNSMKARTSNSGFKEWIYISSRMTTWFCMNLAHQTPY